MGRKYNRFSAKEKDAIKRGVYAFGTKWEKVLQSNIGVLKGRTGVNIKVRFAKSSIS